jgi:cell surface protein SprA
MPTTASGSFSMTIISASTAFESSGNINNNYHSKPFNKFLEYLPIFQSRLEKKYENSFYPISAGEFAGKAYNNANGGVDMYSADVMIPAFLAAYCGKDAHSSSLNIFPTLTSMLPNWTIKYSGLSKLPWFADHFRSFNINHAYKSIFSVGAYNTYSSYMAYMGDMGFITDVTTGNPIPSSMYNISTVSINEAFSPLIGVDMTFLSGMTTKLEYKKVRTLNLSMTSVALTESFSNDIVFGFGYKLKDVELFGAKKIQSTSKSRRKNKKSESKTSSRVGGVSHDLNLRCDFSYRMQNALNRNITTKTTTATSGNTAYKVAITADYTFSKLLTLSGYIDWQRSVPLVSTSSYPTTTADFGVSMKFSLTR